MPPIKKITMKSSSLQLTVVELMLRLTAVENLLLLKNVFTEQEFINQISLIRDELVKQVKNMSELEDIDLKSIKEGSGPKN